MPNTNVHPHSKGGIAERYLGIHRLTPPQVHDVPQADLPMHLTLGDFKLNLDSASGKWQLADGLIQSLQDQIATLHKQLTLAERERQSLLSNPPAAADYSESVVLDLERKQIELEKTNIQLLHENQQLKFKNKVLTAMTAIAEGDYRALCAEAGIDADARQSSQSHYAPLKRVASSPMSATLTGNRGSFSNNDLKRSESYASDNERTVKAPIRYQVAAI